jgi:hypothetical protein
MSDDERMDLDKFDKAHRDKKFDSDEGDKDKKEQNRMQKKLKQKQKKEETTKKDEIDINQFIKMGDADRVHSEQDTEGAAIKKEKKPKLSKKEKRKQKKEQRHADEEEEEKEAKEKEEKEKEEEDEEDDGEWPLKVFYCPICTVPPEYCAFISTDIDNCKERLKVENNDLYEQVYEGRDKEIKEENKGRSSPAVALILTISHLHV